MSAAVTHRRCGSDWQLSPVENILVWHWQTGIITCGQNFGVALTEVSPEYWCGTDSYHTQKKRLVWHWLTVITYRKKDWCDTDWQLSPMGKYWCGTDWQLSPMGNIGVALWLIDSYHLWKKYWCGTDWAITCAKQYWCGTDWANYLCKKILVWHWLSYYLWGKHWYGTDCYHLWREKNIGVALTGSCQLWKKHWCGTNWQLTPMEIFFYWCGTGWQLSHVDKKKIGVELTEVSHVDKYWCGAGWQLLPMEERRKNGVALTDSYQLWRGKNVDTNIGVAQTELSPVETNWCGTDWQLSPMEKILVWHCLRYHLWTEILVWHGLSYHLWNQIGVALTELSLVESNWCGTDWAITCGIKLVWHWLSYHLWNQIGVALTDSYHLWRRRKIGVALTNSYHLWEKNIDVALTDSHHLWKNWCGTDWQLLPIKTLVQHWLAVASCVEIDYVTSWQLSQQL